MPPYTLDSFNAPSLHSPTTQGNREQHCPYHISGKLIKGSGLSQGHTDPAVLGSSTTVWGPHCRAPVTCKHLFVTDFTMLISIMPQPTSKTPQVKGTQGSCANDFRKVNNDLLPPIWLVTLNPGLCSGRVWPRNANCKEAKESALLLGYSLYLLIQQDKFPRTQSLHFLVPQSWTGENKHTHTERI